MPEIPALTVRQPWAWAIARGHKTIENRSWTTNYRGPLAIHAAKKWDDDQEDALRAVVTRIRAQAGHLPTTLAEDLPCSGTGRIVAVVDLAGICTAGLDRDCDCGPWAIRGGMHWRLANARLMDGPVLPGRLGLWRIDLDAA